MLAALGRLIWGTPADAPAKTGTEAELAAKAAADAPQPPPAGLGAAPTALSSAAPPAGQPPRAQTPPREEAPPQREPTPIPTPPAAWYVRWYNTGKSWLSWVATHLTSLWAWLTRKSDEKKA